MRSNCLYSNPWIFLGSLADAGMILYDYVLVSNLFPGP